MHRFYADGLGEIGSLVTLSEEDARHASRVLRMQPGDAAELFLDGRRFSAEIAEMTAEGVTARLTGELPSTEAKLRITLYQGLSKAEKMELIVQKAVELGAARVVPVAMSRCVVQLSAKDGAKKQERWQKIAREACKQSGRCQMMTVDAPIAFPALLAALKTHEAAIVPWEDARGYSLTAFHREHPEIRDLAIVIGPEGGNNGVTGGAMIPMLTLGVPGDAVTAIMIGALTIQGLTPGPMLFQTNKVLVYTIFLGMFIANTLMCICGFAGIRLFTKVLSVPKVILTPCIFVLCVVGSFAMRNNIFDVWVMLISGIIGYFLTKVKVPTSPAILGLILGPMAEKNFRTALLKSSGDPSVFFSTAICWVFIGLILISLCGGHAKEFMASLRRKRAAAKEAKGA